ncbi:MAG: hypothetical protein MUP41_09505 [Desulfobacterales bacterium]|nr:hypothetical protein [Desulfobacterales bacterium]
MKRVKSYHEKIRPQKARYFTTLCERKACPYYTAIASPKYAGICVNVYGQWFIKLGLRKCLAKRRKNGQAEV